MKVFILISLYRSVAGTHGRLQIIDGALSHPLTRMVLTSLLREDGTAMVVSGIMNVSR